LGSVLFSLWLKRYCRWLLRGPNGSNSGLNLTGMKLVLRFMTPIMAKGVGQKVSDAKIN